ncbi:MAG: AmmeMemoRadiSam system radical SAM enzyme [Bacteroidales bacterium]|nr:AmmeMemoRadiSam system radical SAM enzyme [Bacteroidales bacterium]
MTELSLKYENYIECQLCPHFCKLNSGKAGICGVRKNTGEKIELTTYGIVSGIASDPIEKKPLYHFYPGHKILSVGSYGCNMRCDFCQNFHISQNIQITGSHKIEPEYLAKEAVDTENNIGIAFTYNEPVIWFEYVRDVSEIVKKSGLSTVMVSNGYINSKPLSEMTGFIDAFNIDLKAFKNSFYRKLTGTELEPVKSSLKQIVKSGRHLEITTLVIPDENDSEKEMVKQAEWIAGELGKDVPLHLSKYFPTYKRENPSTSEDTLIRLQKIASSKLDFVYIGNNLSEKGQDTVCPKCGETVTHRSGYSTRQMNLDKYGRCSKCGNLIYRNFTISSSTKH